MSRDVLLTPLLSHACEEEMAEKDVKVSNDIFSVHCQRNSKKNYHYYFLYSQFCNLRTSTFVS